MRVDHHSVATGGCARGQRAGRALDADQADPAGAERILAVVVTEHGHARPGEAGGLQDRRPCSDLERDSVDRDLHQLSLSSSG